MDVAGAHVLLTGATGALGRALAIALAGRGARLTLVARGAEALDEVARETGGRAVPTDLLRARDRADLVATAEDRLGPIDVLINNAGVETSAHLADESAETLARAVGLNLLAPMDLSRLALEGMLERDRGTIVNVSSLSAVSAVPGMATYAATKAGLSHFTSGLQADLRTRLLRMTGGDEAAAAVCEALARDRRHLRLPRRAIPYALLTQAPRDLAALALTGTPR